MADVGPGGVRFGIDYSLWNQRFLGLIGLGPRFSEVVVDDINLGVRMGWAFQAHVPRADIRRVAATERPIFAWGVHRLNQSCRSRAIHHRAVGATYGRW